MLGVRSVRCWDPGKIRFRVKFRITVMLVLWLTLPNPPIPENSKLTCVDEMCQNYGAVIFVQVVDIPWKQSNDF